MPYDKDTSMIIINNPGEKWDPMVVASRLCIIIWWAIYSPAYFHQYLCGYVLVAA